MSHIPSRSPPTHPAPSCLLYLRMFLRLSDQRDLLFFAGGGWDDRRMCDDEAETVR